MGKRKSNSTKSSYTNAFRIFSILSGLFLCIALAIQSQGDNICIWRVSCFLNVPVAFITAYSPKYIDSTLWISWSITMSSLHTFLLVVFFIQILRGISAEAEFTYFPEEENASFFSTITNSKYNIFKYDDGKECTVILIILLWIKLSNYARSPRSYKKPTLNHRNLFMFCFLLTVFLISSTFICAYYCQKDFCLSVIGL